MIKNQFIFPFSLGILSCIFASYLPILLQKYKKTYSSNASQADSKKNYSENNIDSSKNYSDSVLDNDKICHESDTDSAQNDQNIHAEITQILEDSCPEDVILNHLNSISTRVPVSTRPVLNLQPSPIQNTQGSTTSTLPPSNNETPTTSSSTNIPNYPSLPTSEIPNIPFDLASTLHQIQLYKQFKESNIHRSITCNSCSTSPIRGFRFKCINCIDFDLCEECESLNSHNDTHVFMKIRVVIPPFANPKLVSADLFYPGTGGDEWIDEYFHIQISAQEVQAFHTQFNSLATIPSTSTTPTGISRQVFNSSLGAIGHEKNLIVDQMFNFFDRNGDCIISFPEFVMGMSVIVKGTLDERIKCYDLNKDGLISRIELFMMFKAYFLLSVQLVKDYVKGIEEGLMNNFDDGGSKPFNSCANFTAAIPNSGAVYEDGAIEKGSGRGVLLESRLPTSSSENESSSGSHYFSLAGSDDDIASEKSKKLTQSPKLQEQDSITLTGNIKTVKQTRPIPIEIPSTNYTSNSPTSQRSASPQNNNNSTGILSKGTRALQEAQILHRKSQGNIKIPQTPLVGGVFESYSSPLPSPVQTFIEFETMSQEAIDEMVDRTFEIAGANSSEHLTFEEFVRAVECDNSYLQWFESLGSCF